MKTLSIYDVKGKKKFKSNNYKKEKKKERSIDIEKATTVKDTYRK